ncbi:hypothetical protein ACFY2R_27595 [Micromonospora olivasterospora]|uniref:Uncharacterized protein n=1 Tax=Micromonospora olivasterospora TaxID=1880 RepID=A0A562IHP0_MICOL|nr:hypothetical protein [Micromonospora olivasterospora]TWH70338.1 hypothetical protein JD77_05363 [Micromonospora olivasterospora]
MAFHSKELRVAGVTTVAGRRLKHYLIDQPDRRITPEVRRAAAAFLPRLLPTGDDGTPPGGWVVLHRGADGAAYLLAYSWFWDNVVEARIGVAGQPALDCPDDDPAHFVELRRPGVGCVWELGVLEHERAAWVRHVLAPERPDLDGYLADTRAAGPVGR